MNIILRILLVSQLLLITRQDAYSFNEELFNQKEFHNLYAAFKYKKDLISFLDIKNGEAIADIGTGNGIHLGALSLLYDSLILYGEDINTKTLNEKSWNKMIRHYSSLREKPQTNQFHMVIGTEKETRLPDNTFDKIIIMGSFHEFTEMDQMIYDISFKLKIGGKIIIQDAFSTADKTIYCSENHKGLRISEVVTIMKKHGFYLTGMLTPESSVVNYSNVLAFEKNRIKSANLFEKITKTDPVIRKIILFADPEVAGDSSRIQGITDSIRPLQELIANTYVAYDSWITEIALIYHYSKNYGAAINLFNSAISLFPDYYLNYYYLGEAYEMNKQYYKAYCAFKKSYSLNSSDSKSKDRIRKLSKKVVVSE
jgi:tetratricopeptide (TPR) repeat protein